MFDNGAAVSTQLDAQRVRFVENDWILCFSFAALAATIAVWGFRILGWVLYNEASGDIWFQADIPRVITNLTDAASNHYRTSVHPISSILLTPIVSALSRLAIAPFLAVKLLIVSSAALNGGTFFAVLRYLGLPRLVAVLFGILYLSSAAFLHWYSVVELNSIASVTIVLAVLMLAYGRTRLLVWPVLVTAATLSITVTNWSVGLITTLVRWSFSRFVEISSIALVLVMLLSLAQHFIFRNAVLFFWPSSIRAEIRWTQPAIANRSSGTWRPFESLRSLLVTTVIAPDPEIEIQDGSKVVTNQRAAITRNTTSGLVASVAWITLLGCGFWGAISHLQLRPVATGLGLMLLTQMLLHSIYGEVTFLYALHVLPMLVALASLSWLTPARWIAVILAVVVSASGSISNVHQLLEATRLANQILDQGGNVVDPDFSANEVIAPAPLRR